MRSTLTILGISACCVVMTGCATTDNYASACQRDYERNRQYATGAGAALGAAVGAAIAGKEDRERGAAIGALAGGLLGNQLSAREDPCGYGFGGYNNDGRYGYTRVPRPGDYGYYR
ncbi:MAG: glycine zipper 2TM domain-containing protein [Brevundimonas sp.]